MITFGDGSWMPICFAILPELRHYADTCSATEYGHVMRITMLHCFGMFVHRRQSKAVTSTQAAATQYKMPQTEFS